ncbi:hypothetical protein B6U99_03110 [Candidatus Geothermarchaeota archaeon ex4572_27]|nr:MAG: hypothetical protein B6U99_03110 [Candidatus Geothermarchaeota archaeon ex4572_27]
MSEPLVLFEDDSFKRLLPLTYTRHPAELLIGGLSNLERARMLRRDVYLLGRGYLKAYVREEYGLSLLSSGDEAASEIRGDRVIGVNAMLNAGVTSLRRLVGELESMGDAVLVSGGRVVGFSLRASMLEGVSAFDGGFAAEARRRGARVVEVSGWRLIGAPWDLVYSIGERVCEDAHAVEAAEAVEANRGEEGVYLLGKADIEEGVYFDTEGGPIVIEDGARIRYGTIVEGPAWIKGRAEVLSAKVREDSVIGYRCKVGVEIEMSVMDCFSNAAHHGFIGHSYVGRWVNIGAQTTFSDLKNTYGTVKISVNGVLMDSGKVKLGPFVADYAKLSIGSLVYCGRWVGCASHIYRLVDRDIPSFVIWAPEGAFELDFGEAVEIHRRMFARRDRTFSRAHEEVLRRVFEETRGEREGFGAVRARYRPGG